MSTLPLFTLLTASEVRWADMLAGRRAPEVIVVASRPAPEGEDGPVIAPGVLSLAERMGVDLPARLARAKASGRAAEVVELQIDPSGASVERLLVVGLGDESVRDLRRAAAAVSRRTRDAKNVVVDATMRADAGALRAF